MSENKAGGGQSTAPGTRNQWNRASICIDCGRGGGLCPWSQRFEPIPGWKAEKVILRTQRGGKSKHEEIFKVIECPGFCRRERSN